MFCRKCGRQLTDGVLFCAGCGEPVQASEKVEPVQQTSYETTPAAVEAGTVHKPKSSRFIMATLICGVVFAVISFAATVFTVTNWRTIATLFYQQDFSNPNIVFVVPYFDLAISLITLIVSVLALCFVIKQLKNEKTSVVWETLTLVCFGLRPLILYLCNTISSMLWCRDVAPDMFDDVFVYQLTTVARSAVSSAFSFIDNFCFIGIAMAIAGCGASIVTKRYIKNSRFDLD